MSLLVIVLIIDRHIDLLWLTETWFRQDFYVGLNVSLPNCQNPWRVNGIFHTGLLVNHRHRQTFNSFERLILTLKTQNNSIYMISHI